MRKISLALAGPVWIMAGATMAGAPSEYFSPLSGSFNCTVEDRDGVPRSFSGKLGYADLKDGRELRVAITSESGDEFDGKYVAEWDWEGLSLKSLSDSSGSLFATTTMMFSGFDWSSKLANVAVYRRYSTNKYFSGTCNSSFKFGQWGELIK
jgi:hypothetical protein